jgi:RNA polymerase sigma-70 factor (ECF subfamily)
VASFDEFYAAHFGALTVQLYGMTGDMAEAQDLVQEAFTRAWQRWDRIVDYDDPVSWVRRVALNLATSRWRHARTALRYLASQRIPHTDGPGPDRVALVQAMRGLPQRQRQALTLHYLADMSTEEIARECGVPPSTVRSWLHRGRASLLSRMSDEETPRERRAAAKPA